ncbi:hypothetical protein [Fimbriiglobus ruber]|uniref:VWFA domain-containing protein n=1 Tax=Fimbriiglobus ruber TaxID=1908690 RepID=A0A225EF19_9BACT|nr:hypothetical protein [Fimbriiglobus ruber]OWK46847.1 hypothetical protein FRUB_00546 [Fimbriiglobus ruber]
MPYAAEISRTNPACFILLIDQSGSMDDPFAGEPDTKKSVVVADGVNKMLQNLVLRSAKADGVRDYFHVAVIGYGKMTHAGLGGRLPTDALVPISRLADSPLRIETRTKTVSDGAGGLLEKSVKVPVWFDPVANGRTPMCEALSAAWLTAREFIERYPTAYPPIVLNLTDGRPSDGNPQDTAKNLRRLATADGNVLLFNLLLSTEPKPPMYFISDGSLLVDLYSKLLFVMSSQLPPRMLQGARAEGFDVEEGARGVVFNADPAAVVRFLDIGTRVASVYK